MVIDGRIVEGHHGGGGEIGDTTRMEAGVGVIHEEQSGGRALERLGRDPAHLFSGADGADDVRAGLVAIFEPVAQCLVNLVVALDPESVVLGGGMLRTGL